MCETPKSRTGILLRLGDSARKIEAIEKLQAEQMESRIETQHMEIDRLTNALNKAMAEKRAHISKLVQMHKDFDACERDDSTNAIIDSIGQSSANERALQAQIKDLKRELKSVTDKTGDDEEEDITEMRNTMKSLKEQVDGVEEYVRKGVRFERDETKGRIKRLERTLLQLREQLRTTQSESSDFKEVSDVALHKIQDLCAEMEANLQRKCDIIAQMKRENSDGLKLLEMKTKDAAEIQTRLKQCETQIISDYQI